MSKLRIRFAKIGKVRWTSHRDVARMWERAFRRASLPLVYSGGFAPRPKVSFGLALPTGYESVAEYLDVELAEGGERDVLDLPERLSSALPLGVDATAAAAIPAGTRSLQEDVVSCSWRWLVGASEESGPFDAHLLADRVAAVLDAPSVVVRCARKGGAHDEDIRAGILELRLGEPAGDGGAWLEAGLACVPRLLRPAEVTSALGAPFEVREARRTHQWILRDGTPVEPLRAALSDGATDAPRVWERAS